MDGGAVEAFHLARDGDMPNNPLPLVLLRAALPPESRHADGCQTLFRRNGWRGTWVNGVYDFWHFHTRGHEVLGCVAGTARIGFGGDGGIAADLEAGDVVVIPAGIGHKRLSASPDFRVVGAYPPGQEGEITRPGDLEGEEAARRVADVDAPESDPVAGSEGVLLRIWS